MLLSAPASFSKPTTAKNMSLSIQQTADVLRQAGFKESEIPTMVAIGIGESGLRPDAHNPTYPDDSYGLFQINMLDSDKDDYYIGKERRARYGLQSNEQLKDPLTNAKAALDIRNRQGLGAWSVYSQGIYKKHLPKVLQVLGSSGGVKSTSEPQPMLTPPPPVDKEEEKSSINLGFLKNFINNLRGREQSMISPKSGLDTQAMLAKAFQAPKLMD